MAYIRHIVVFYNREQEAVAEFLSSFFRMTGIYVLMRVIEELNTDDDLNYSDYVLVLNNVENEIIRKSFCEKNWLDIDSFSWMNANTILEDAFSLRLSDLQQEEFLCHVLRMMENRSNETGISAETFQALYSLAKVYVEKQLLYPIYQMRLFTWPKEKKKEEITSILSVFNDAARLPSTDRYSCFFVQECRRKVNLACRLGGFRKQYDTEEMISTICRWAKIYPDYTAFWLQAALVADEDIDHMYSAVEYYERQMQEEKSLGIKDDEKYQGYTWYRLGRYYEKVKDKKENAFQCYTQAYELSPFNYRFTYKMAFMHEVMGEKQEAIRYYEKILEQLMPYITGNYLTTCKCEYAFKVSIKLLKLYKTQMQYKMASEMGELAVRLRNNIDENRFLYVFYMPDKASEIQKGTKERLETRWVEEEKERIDDLILKYF